MTENAAELNSRERHRISRFRFEPKRRLLKVHSTNFVTPKMLRVVFKSNELADFVSLGPDDHVKLILPGHEAPRMRDYTPRSFNPAARTLSIDFALDRKGPATAWARNARLGENLLVGGPRGSSTIEDDFDWYVLISDETGLPSIARRLEQIRSGALVYTIVVLDNVDEVQVISTRAAWRANWVFRDGCEWHDTALLNRAIDTLDLPPGDGYVWIAAEATVAKALRERFVVQLRHNLHWVKASGYWLKGKPGTHEKIE